MQCTALYNMVTSETVMTAKGTIAGTDWVFPVMNTSDYEDGTLWLSTYGSKSVT